MQDEWQNYFQAKQEKLKTQIGRSSDTDSTIHPQLFQNIRIYINGYTDPPEPELREMFTRHGGEYSQFFSTTRTDFVIATNLPVSKKRLMGGKALKPDWIVDSVQAGTKLDVRKYLLYDSNLESRQSTLDRVVGLVPAVTETNLIKTSSPDDPHLVRGSSVEQVATSSKDCIQNPETSRSNNSILGMKSTTDEGFLESFYNKSRLHLISQMKKETQEMVASWRRNLTTHSFSLLESFTSEQEVTTENDYFDLDGDPVIFHIDMDCFFVAVGRLSRPNLVGVPVAVTHSKGTGPSSKSEIACVSYEGRAMGLSAGMWVDEAKRLCPGLQTIPYEFDEYRRVSKMFFETVTSLSMDIEPISCDELYLDATEVLRDCPGNPVKLAKFLRLAIKNSAGVDASVGIGNSKLSARIATSLAKEKREGVRLLKPADVEPCVRNLPVHKLPGVGYSTSTKLNETHKISTCAELQTLSLNELKQSFGEKTGEKLYWLSRGVDKEAVHSDVTHHQAKSVSAGCSYGVRFTAPEDVNFFIKQLSSELEKRALQSSCYGKKLTISLWIVRKGHEHEPIKPGGHGVVDILSRTRNLLTPTRDSEILSSVASEQCRSITKSTVPPNHIRGVRLALSNLTYELDMTAKERKSVQTSIASGFLSRPIKSSTITSPSTSASINPAPMSCPSELEGEGEAALYSTNSAPMTTHDTPESEDTAADVETSYMDTNASQLPFLNGFTSIREVTTFIRNVAFSDRRPSRTDVHVLETYIADLLEASFLQETYQLLSFLLEMIGELQSQGVLAVTWSAAFIMVIRNLEPLILEKYGDYLPQHSHVSGC